MAQERRALAVRLERSGDRLDVEYHLPEQGRIGAAARPWGELGNGWRCPAGAGPDGLNALLDGGVESELLDHCTGDALAGVGHMLFDLLFGAPAQWEPVLRRAFGVIDGPCPAPVRQPVRLRVWTTDPLLAALPWRATAWQAHFLGQRGWTFEVSPSGQPQRNIDLPVPSTLLVLAPEVPGRPLGTADHLTALREVLERVSPHYREPSHLRVARTRAEAADAFAGMRPQLLYYYGHGEIRGGQPCLLLEGDAAPVDPVSMADLWLMMGGSFPLAAYLNACKSAARGWHAAGNQLCPDVPVVVAHRTTAWSEHAGARALDWLDACLGGSDPVAALHELPPTERTRSFQWVTATVHAEYQSWTVSRPAPRPASTIGIGLDRDIQRALVAGHVSSLVGSDTRKVEAMVAYAAPGNWVGGLARQLRDYLEEHDRLTVRVGWLQLRFPADRRDLAAGLRHELSVALEQEGDEPLEHALRRAAPRGSGSATSLLWLDWGVFGGGDQAPLRRDELRDWLAATAEELAFSCPPEIRLVSYLAMELAEGRSHQTLFDTMEQFRERFDSDRFRCHLIPALPPVTRNDVRVYLLDWSNARCPRELAGRAAELICARTRGSYEETMALIREGARSWHALIARLETGAAPGPPIDDVEFS